MTRHSQPGWIALILILLLAFALRALTLDAQSLWYDEGNTVALVVRPLSRIIAGAAADIHPPGYYILEAGWVRLAGTSEFSLRYFSLMAGLITVAAVGAAGRRLFDQNAGLFAGLLAAVHPLLITYSQEARMYALVGACAALGLLFTAEVLTLPGEMQAGRFDQRRAAWIIGGYIGVHALGMYTHYSFPFVIAAESLLFLLWLARRSKPIHGLMVWIMLQSGVFGLFLPQLRTAWRQVFGWPLQMEAAPALRIIETVLLGVTAPVGGIAVFGSILLLVLAVLAVIVPIGPHRYLRHAERVGLPLALLAAMTFLLIASGTITEANFKFLLPPAVGLCILVGAGLSVVWQQTPASTRSPALGTVLIMLAIPVGASLQNLYTHPDYARDDYRGIAAMIREQAGDDAAVVLNAPNQAEVFTYYYPDGPGIMRLPDPQADVTEAQLQVLVSTYDRIYGMYWGDWLPDPERTVERRLEELTYPVDSRWFGDVRVVTYAVPAPPATEIETPTDVTFGEVIHLDGFTLGDADLEPGSALGVTLFWRITEATEDRYKVFVHLYDASGAIIAQHDAEPGNNLKPTWIWGPGEQISDAHGLLIPVNLPPGTYRLAVGMYPAFGEEGRLPVTTGEQPVGDVFPLTEIVISGP